MCVCLKPYYPDTNTKRYRIDYLTTSGAGEQCFDEQLPDCLYLMFCHKYVTHMPPANCRGYKSGQLPKIEDAKTRSP